MWQFVGAACAMIKAMDPNHPVGTATPDIDQFTIFALNTYVPMVQAGYTAAALDFLGSNLYGNAGLLYPSALQACAQTPPGTGCSLAAANTAYAWSKPVRSSDTRALCLLKPLKNALLDSQLRAVLDLQVLASIGH